MQQLLEALFAACYNDVYRYLYSLCRDAALAEELAAETFLEATKSIGGFRAEADAKTWLFTLARRRWFAHLRRKQQTPSAPPEELERWLSPAPTPQQQAEGRAALARLEQLLAAEPPRTQDIVRLRAAGYSYYEIAQKHGISENSARVIDFRAKAKLKAALQKEGLWDE